MKNKLFKIFSLTICAMLFSCTEETPTQVTDVSLKGKAISVAWVHFDSLYADIKNQSYESSRKRTRDTNYKDIFIPYDRAFLIESTPKLVQEINGDTISLSQIFRYDNNYENAPFKNLEDYDSIEYRISVVVDEENHLINYLSYSLKELRKTVNKDTNNVVQTSSNIENTHFTLHNVPYIPDNYRSDLYVFLKSADISSVMKNFYWERSQESTTEKNSELTFIQRYKYTAATLLPDLQNVPISIDLRFADKSR
jgi:hypothetical protein